MFKNFFKMFAKCSRNVCKMLFNDFAKCLQNVDFVVLRTIATGHGWRGLQRFNVLLRL